MQLEGREAGAVQGSGRDPLVGRTIAGRFRIDALLGASVSGRLYRASLQPLDRAVVLRVLPLTRPSPQADERFVREAAIAGKLTHHNTVRLIDFGRTEEGAPFLAMEFLNGRTLAQTIAEAPLQQVRAIHVAQQMCRSLREAHALEVLHRGLRPSSVMLLRQQDEQDFVKVMDYGLPIASGGSALAGLPTAAAHYLAPEQARNQQLDPRCDVYALGAILYEMLTGRTPFSGPTAADVIVRHLAEQPVPPRQVRPDLRIEPGLERLVMRCLSKDRAARHSTMDELLAQLKLVRAQITHTRVAAQTLPPTRVEQLVPPLASVPPRGTPAAVAPVTTQPPPPPREAQVSKPPARSEPLFTAVASSLQPKPWRLFFVAAALAALAALGALALREPAPAARPAAAGPAR